MIARSCTAQRRVGAGPSPGQAALEELARRVIDAVDGLLVRQPLNEVSHAIFEPRRGAEAQELSSARRVGVAVANVARPVLARPHWIDLEVELLREDAGDVVDSRRPPGSEVD